MTADGKTGACLTYYTMQVLCSCQDKSNLVCMQADISEHETGKRAFGVQSRQSRLRHSAVWAARGIVCEVTLDHCHLEPAAYLGEGGLGGCCGAGCLRAWTLSARSFTARVLHCFPSLVPPSPGACRRCSLQHAQLSHVAPCQQVRPQVTTTFQFAAVTRAPQTQPMICLTSLFQAKLGSQALT